MGFYETQPNLGSDFEVWPVDENGKYFHPSLMDIKNTDRWEIDGMALEFKPRYSYCRDCLNTYISCIIV